MNAIKTFFISGLIFTFTSLANADLFYDLSKLKKICDADLLTKKECASRKTTILSKYDEEKEVWFCNYAGELTGPKLFTKPGEEIFRRSSSASSVVKEILDEAGLAPNFIVRPADVPSAAASARNGQRYIEYNPSFVSQLINGDETNWPVYSVMAHEIGHHLQGHTLQPGGSRPDIELEADEYSGFILAKLGASLDDAQKAMKKFGSDTSSGLHPTKNNRLIAIQQGWSSATKSRNKTRQTETVSTHENSLHAISPQPTVKYTDSCIVNGEAVLITTDGAVLSKIKGYMQVGQKVPASHHDCIFDMLSDSGKYCVTENGDIFFGSPIPVGQCQPCNENMCN